MGRLVAISGGDLRSTEKINRFIVDLAGKTRRNLLFIGTASGDNAGYRERVADAFGKLGYTVKALCLTLHHYSEDEIDQMIGWSDIIYVGGGDTFAMMEYWRTCGLPRKLRKVYEDDSAVLAGISAGAICWFRCGHSDSERFWVDGEVNYGWVEDLLDLYPLAFCPHYEERRDVFPEMLRQKKWWDWQWNPTQLLWRTMGRFLILPVIKQPGRTGCSTEEISCSRKGWR